MVLDNFDLLADDMFQCLDKDGNLVAEDPGLEDSMLKDMYWWMVLARMADEKALSLQRQGRIGTFAPSKGQEAAQIGPAMAMSSKDWFFPAFRELAAYLIRGIPLENVLLYFMGDPRGNIIPDGINNLPIYVPVGTQVPQAVGAAHAMTLRNEKNAVVCFFGDGATSEGDFHEGLNFSGVMNAPVVFICQNNQWAISVPRSRQSASRTLAQKALAYGIRGIQVDGNDVLAMYVVCKEALERARRGGGPTLIEAYTYRLSMHTTADDPTRYRKEGELKEWMERDPLIRFKKYLTSRGIWTDEWQDRLEGEAKSVIDKAIDTVENMDPLMPGDLFEHMFEEMPAYLRDQLEYLKKCLDEREIEEDAEEIQGGFP